MPRYSISVSVTVDAEDDDAAYRTAHEITDQLGNIGDDPVILDVEETDE